MGPPILPVSILSMAPPILPVSILSMPPAGLPALFSGSFEQPVIPQQATRTEAVRSVERSKLRIDGLLE